MKNLFYLVLFLVACSSDVRDQAFDPNTYDHFLKKIYQSDQITDDEAFLVNYAVLRQRPYYQNSLEGMTYGEILDKAKTYQSEGLPIIETIENNSPKNEITITVKNEGSGMVRTSPDSKRMIKMLRFAATYTNPTDQELAIENSTFIVRGPFNEHITTLAYEINCRIPAGEKLSVFFVADSRNIRRNLLANNELKQSNIMFDQLVKQLTITTSGNTVSNKSRQFSDCLSDGARREPFYEFNYTKDFSQDKVTDKDGKKIIPLGKTHYLPELSDEPIQM